MAQFHSPFKILLLALTLSLSVGLALPQAMASSSEARLQAEQLHQELVATDLIIKLGESLQDHPLNAGDLRQRMEEFLRARVPEASHETVKKTTSLIHWSALLEHIRHAPKAAYKIGRLNGMGVAVAFWTSLSAEFLVPVLLTAIGAPHLIGVSVVFPYQAAVPAALVTKKVIHKKHMIRALGSKEAYAHWQEQIRLIRSSLRIQNKHDLLLPLAEAGESVKAAVIAKDSFFRRLAERFGWKKKRLSFKNLMEFAEQQRWTSPVLELAKSDESLPQHLKTALVLNDFFQNADSEMIDEFITQFPNSILQKTSAASWSELSEWKQESLRARNLNELRLAFEKIPHDASVAQVTALWKGLVLPHLAEHATEIPYGAFRTLVKSFVELEARVILNPTARWDLMWENHFKDYLMLGVKTSPCAMNLDPLWGSE